MVVAVVMRMVAVLSVLPARTACFSLSMTSTMPRSPSSPLWLQKTISVTAPKRGAHLITKDVTDALHPDLRDFKCGLAHIFVKHTSCSLTINENCDPEVRSDMNLTVLAVVVIEAASMYFFELVQNRKDVVRNGC